MKVTIKAHVHAKNGLHYDAETKTHIQKTAYELYPFDMSKATYSEGRVLIGIQDVTVEIPESFDIRDGLVKNLEREKKALMAEFNKRVTEIDRQIQTYLAIEA